MHLLLTFLCYISIALGTDLPQAALRASRDDRNVSIETFHELEELARVVDISYCVGITGTGIQKPFQCASRCSEFEDFELVTTWSTGQMMSDSCGYIALSHPPSPARIILAFRGTYSMANTIADLSTIPQEYVPYPGDEDDDEDPAQSHTWLSRRKVDPTAAECSNCTVHMGFLRSWRNTKSEIMPYVEELVKKYPQYELTLVGHSLGGAVAALASLDFHGRGWNPKTTTFGEPRIGNQELIKYLDKTFEGDSGGIRHTYRRVTHVDDPIPLLPLTEWGFRPHAGEIYISKQDTPPEVRDLRYCDGDADPKCLAGAEGATSAWSLPLTRERADIEGFLDWWEETKGSLSIPPRWRIWQLFFAHRDYFWRLGLCVPWTGLEGSDQGNVPPTEL